MDINWLIIILGFAAILVVITFLVKENQEDEKATMRKSLEGDERSKIVETDTEVKS